MGERPNNWKRLEFYLAALLIIGAILILIGWFMLRTSLDTVKKVDIKEGQGLYVIANVLKEEKVIRSKFLFVIYVWISGNERKLQAGRYVLKPGTTIPEIVYMMVQGDAESDDIIAVIPEGFNVFDIDKRLASLALIKEGEFVRRYVDQEGKFSPNTYRLKKEGETADTIAEKIKNHSSISYNTLIIASLLEKEAKAAQDMQIIAGIITKRLKMGFLLQIDAAVSYGVCLRELKNQEVAGFKYCDVSQVPVGVEIKINGSYNTYIRPGLPPGPIANPGPRAIEAALNPIDTDYFYYLSTRDSSQIIFAKTPTEHATNRRKYLGL